MNNEKELFNKPKKWNAFLKLSQKKERIKNNWYKKIANDCSRYFNAPEGKLEGWGFDIIGDYDMKWELNELGNNSLHLYLGWEFQFALRNLSSYDVTIVNKLLNTPDFSTLKSFFDEFNASSWRIASKKRNYSFDGNEIEFDIEELAWYAENRTRELRDQIIERVDFIRRDKEMVNLIIKLNKAINTK